MIFQSETSTWVRGGKANLGCSHCVSSLGLLKRCCSGGARHAAGLPVEQSLKLSTVKKEHYKQHPVSGRCSFLHSENFW